MLFEKFSIIKLFFDVKKIQYDFLSSLEGHSTKRYPTVPTCTKA